MQNYENEITSQKRLVKKRNKKYQGNVISIKLQKYNPDTKLKKRYTNQYFCISTLRETANGKIYSHHCKTKTCKVCASMKEAKLMRMFLEPLKTLANPQFVTLTLPTVYAGELKEHVNKFENAWRLIYKQTKKAKYKRTNITFRGFRKMEIKPSKGNKFNVHFHIIVNDESQANYLINCWTKHFPEANLKAQHIRAWDKTQKGLLEMFKYTTKSIELETKENEAAYYRNINIIEEATIKKQQYVAFGIKAVKEVKDEREVFDDSTPTDEIIIVRSWNQTNANWFDINTGEAYIDKPITEQVKNKY